MKKLLILGGMLAIPFSSFATVLFDQSTNMNPDGYYSDSLASNGSQYYGHTVAESFTITDNSTISSITFWGGSEFFLNDDNSNISSFEINIFDGSFASVATWTLSLASVTPTVSGLNGSLTGNTGYVYTATVSQALTAGSYFMNIGANLVDPIGDAWGWSLADGDSDLKANFFDGDGWIDLPGFRDTAFRIEGTVDGVPEPASLAVLGIGALALLRRRKK